MNKIRKTLVQNDFPFSLALYGTCNTKQCSLAVGNVEKKENNYTHISIGTRIKWTRTVWQEKFSMSNNTNSKVPTLKKNQPLFIEDKRNKRIKLKF